MYVSLAAFAALVFFYSLISERIERSLSGPIFFVAVGAMLGPVGFGWFSPTEGAVNGKALIDITLALFLFVDAANADVKVLRSHWRIPGRMLLLGLPMSMGLGATLALVLFPELSFYEMAILGVMLAATDAALGKAVVINQSVPAHLREGLSAESGLNDGLCVPFLLLFVALESGAAARGEGVALELLSEELGLGVLAGAVVSATAAKALLVARKAGWLGHVWQRVTVPALAVLVFALAQSLHGSGYIAAFVGGLCFRVTMQEDVHSMLLPAETVGELLAMCAWVLFGMILLPAALPHIGGAELIYALLSLTVVRMLPIMLSLAGTGEPAASKAFLAWFGPRGLASLAFATIVWNEQIPGAGTIIAVTILTVGLSLLAHGLTARPFADRLARQLA